MDERAVDDERVADDPPDVRGGPVDVALADLEEGPRQVRHPHQVAAGGVHHALGLPGGARGVEDEERILRVHHLGLAVDRPRVLHVVEVVLALGVQLHRRVPGPRAAPVHDDVLHRRQAAHRFVHRGLERERLAAPVRVVGAHHHLRARVDDARLERLRAHAAEDHRVDGADPRAGEHGHDALGHQGHVDDDAISLAHAQLAQRVGEAAHLPVQPAIGEGDLVAVFAHPDQRRLEPPLGGARAGRCS